MACELTKDGLFHYFGPNVTEKIINLPLIQRHLSALDYRECQDVLSDLEKKAVYGRKEHADYTHALLGFDILKDASLDEILLYLSIEEVRAAYLQHYKDYFLMFEERIFALKHHPEQGAKTLPFLLDAVSEQKLILLVKGSMGTPLAAFNNALMEQNILLEQLQSQFVKQAGNAEKFVTAIRGENTKYQQTIVSLAFSIAKMGLGVINVGEIVEVSKSIAALATSTFEKIEAKLPSLISDIKHLVVNNHFQALQDAENNLLSTANPEDIRYSWEMYRTKALLNANKSIRDVLNSCIQNDDFIRCVIKEVICHERELTFDKLFIAVADKTNQYIEEIVKSLQSRIAIIRQIAEAAASQECGQKIEKYYRQIGLIDYTLQHENTGRNSSDDVTKKLGHLLSRYFPRKVFQKKWSSEYLTYFFCREIKYAKETLSLDQYQARRKQATVVLGLVRNSSSVKRNLFETLEEEIPALGDELIEELKEYKPNPYSLYNFSLNPVNSAKRRYSFVQRKQSLFNPSPFSTPSTSPSSSPASSPSSSPMSIPKKVPTTPATQRSSPLQQVTGDLELEEIKLRV